MSDCLTLHDWAKIVFGVINFILLLSGTWFIVIGVWLKVHYIDAHYNVMTIFTISVGVITAVVAIIGCGVAHNCGYLFLIVYAACMIMVGIMSLVLGIWAFVSLRNDEGQISSKVSKFLPRVYNNYYSNSEDAKIVDTLQIYLKCCGIKETLEDPLLQGTHLMTSCCGETVKRCDKRMAYQRTCSERLVEYIKKSNTIIGGIAMGVSLFAFLVAGFTIWEVKRYHLNFEETDSESSD